MPRVIQSIFVDPPLAVARLGGSSVPQHAYKWVETPRPRTIGETTVAPTWTLAVQADGTVAPFKPDKLVFRDGASIRPVCPFFEVWARMGEAGSAPSTWEDVPLTPAVLAAAGTGLGAVTVAIDAKNFKAARRTGNTALAFGTYPPVEVSGDNHASVPLLATSPPRVAQPMIPRGKNIPLGSVQVLRSRTQPPGGADWVNIVNVEVLRIRFTPARGHVYGVPQAAQPSRTPGGGRAVPVESTRAFLNPNSGWFGARSLELDLPADTYDGAMDTDRPSPSLGVVDDTCDARITVTLRLPGSGARILTAMAHVFVGPPHFAPDRRPFFSAADEINDRTADAGARNAALSSDERDKWVEDLFERIFETVSLFNVDWRREDRAATLRGQALRPIKIVDDGVPNPTIALGGRDRLRNADYAIPAAAAGQIALPLSQHAQMRHRTLSDLAALRDFVVQHPGRLRDLVRPPFAISSAESPNATTMQMPPLMRNSNAQPLTLTAWQYDLLIAWVGAAETAPSLAQAFTAPSGAALERRAAVLRRLSVQGEGRQP